MQVTRVWEAPRVTKPYTEEQWVEIENLGHQIDDTLQALDVRLTQGGEPTFVAVDDPDGAEWNTEARPDQARRRRNLPSPAQYYAPSGLMHFGQGKWYPGEQLPRWSLNCFWRKDGEPIWSSPELYADEKRDYGATSEHSERFMKRVAERLALDPSMCSRPSRMPTTTCGANVACPTTSIPSIRGSTTHSSASA